MPNLDDYALSERSQLAARMWLKANPDKHLGYVRVLKKGDDSTLSGDEHRCPSCSAVFKCSRSWARHKRKCPKIINDNLCCACKVMPKLNSKESLVDHLRTHGLILVGSDDRLTVVRDPASNYPHDDLSLLAK